jgi:hypothetical protein
MGFSPIVEVYEFIWVGLNKRSQELHSLRKPDWPHERIKFELLGCIGLTCDKFCEVGHFLEKALIQYHVLNPQVQYLVDLGLVPVEVKVSQIYPFREEFIVIILGCLFHEFLVRQAFHLQIECKCHFSF